MSTYIAPKNLPAYALWCSQNALTNLWSWRGRANRWEFIVFRIVSTLLANAVGVGIMVGIAGLQANRLEPGLSLPALLLAGVGIFVFLTLAYTTILVTIRRLHDVDLSGWWYLLILAFSAFMYQYGGQIFTVLPSYIIMFLLAYMPDIVLALMPGTYGPNRFGAMQCWSSDGTCGYTPPKSAAKPAAAPASKSTVATAKPTTKKAAPKAAAKTKSAPKPKAKTPAKKKPIKKKTTRS